MRAYSRRRGCSHEAVRQAISSERLVQSVVSDSSGRFLGIDPELADREWEANTHPLQPKGATPKHPAIDQPALPGFEGTLGARTERRADDELAKSTKAQANRAMAVRAVYEARLRELDYHERAGALVPVNKVRAEAFGVWRRHRDRVLGISARIAALVAAEQTESACLAIIDRELRAALEILAGEIERSARATT